MAGVRCVFAGPGSRRRAGSTGGSVVERPHWLIGGNNGTSSVLARVGWGVWQMCRLVAMTWCAFLSNLAIPFALVPRTSASTIRRHLRSAHGPHSTRIGRRLNDPYVAGGVGDARARSWPASGAVDDVQLADLHHGPVPNREGLSMRPTQVVLCRGGRTFRRSSRGTAVAAAPACISSGSSGSRSRGGRDGTPVSAAPRDTSRPAARC